MDDRTKDVFASWSKFLHPQTPRSNLIVASLFIVAYELLDRAIIDRLKDFYCFGFDENGPTVSPKYQQSVLFRDKSVQRASMLWLKESQVMDDADIAMVDKIRQHRNVLAHELPRFISTISAEINVELLWAVCELITKIDRWWIVQVEVPINPDFNEQEIIEDEIQSGTMLMLYMMIQIATGDETESTRYYDEFVRRSGELAQGT